MDVVFQNKKRAANGTRTRDLDLGKVALYQLSYCRNTKKIQVKRRRLLNRLVPRTGLEPARR